MITILKGKKVYHKPSKKILTVKKDYENGELLFSNNILGRDCDVIVMEETIEYIQKHQFLLLEFEDLLNSDKDFNYKKSEFINWFFDQVYNL